MSKLNQNTSVVSRAHWTWLLPLLALTSLPIAGSGCNNSGVIGDDCPTTKDCTGSAGSGSGNPVDTTCGGLLGTVCAKGLYCEYSIGSACGATDQTGVCKATPAACDEIYAPVCGCDGKTYSSDCTAHAEGTSVASKGECANGAGGSNGGGGTGSGGSNGGGATCGGLLSKDCPDGQYCNYPAATKCGSGDQTGFCSVKPQACDAVYAPVCGCDGKTYSSDCAAASAGVTVAKTGECASTTGKACGARAGDTCATGEYCMYKPAAMCGRADATGTCTPVLDGGCLANYDPVCGCDGMTYGNTCEAGRAGASVDHTGECAATGETCGGLLGADCKAGFFCNFPAGSACGAGDMTGNCAAIPQVCNDISAPVCGCDGKPYANACEANAKGTSVAKQGACAK